MRDREREREKEKERERGILIGISSKNESTFYNVDTRNNFEL